MSLEKILDRIHSTFSHHADEARVILLHPESRYRTALISRLLADESIPVYYYALSVDDIDLQTFLSGFTHDMVEQIPTFGTNINMVAAGNPNNLTALLEAFQQDLTQLNNKPFLLVFDEFDRAKIADDLERFFEALVDYLPSQARMVISSRSLPRFPWMALIAQRKAVMLHDDEQISEDFYRNQAQGKARVEAFGLGPGAVTVDSGVIENWEGHLPRLLLFFALERPVVTRSEICQAFWPDLSNDQAVNVFHVTKRRLHKAIETLGVDVLIHEDGTYRVNPELSVRYDLTDFVTAIVKSRIAPREKRTATWQKVIDLYQRPFLQGHNEAWVLKRRAEYQAGYLEALTEMSNIRQEEGRPEAALPLLQQALKENWKRQDIHRRIMKLYADLGRRSEAASHFQRLSDMLGENRLVMEPETQQLYKSLMS